MGARIGGVCFGILLCVAACGDNLEAPPLDLFLETQAPAQAAAGDVITVTCILTEGELIEAVDATVVVTPEASVQESGGEIIAATVGEVEVGCTLPDRGVSDPTPAVVTIVHGPAALVETEVTPNPLVAGDTLSATCTVFDAFGNVIDDADPTLGVTPTDPGNTIEGLDALMTTAGLFDVACQVPGATGEGEEVEVMPGLPASIVLGQEPATTVHPVDGVVEITHVVSDQYGNEIPDAVVVKTSAPVTGVGPTDVLGPDTFQYHGEGRYRVEAVVEPPTEGELEVSATIDVVIDESGPRLLCNSPGDATMLDVVPGSNVTFTGSAADVSGIVEASINGAPVTIDEDGTFSASVKTRFGMNFVEIAAADDNNFDSTRVCVFLVASEWAPQGSTLASTLDLELRQAAWDDGVRGGTIDDFDDILSRVLNSQGMRDTVHDALLDANPLKASSCDQQLCVPFVGCTCVLRSEVTYIRSEFNGPNTSALALVTGGVKVDTRLENIRVRLRVRGHVAGIPYDTTGWVNIRSVDVDLILDTALSGGLPNVTVRSGSVAVAVGSISTDFSGIDGAVVDIIATVANAQVRTIVANAIRGFVVNNFNAVLDGLISSLDIENLGAIFNVPRIGGGSIPVSFGIGFSSLGTTSDHMLVGIGTRFTAPAANNYATLGAPIPPGPVAIDPTGSTPAIVAAHVALFNQLLHALWRGGMFEVEIDISALDASLPDGVSAIITTRLPPVAMIDGSQVVLHLGGIEAEVNHPDLPASLRVALGATARTTVTLSNGDLQFGAITIEELYFSSDQLEIGPDDLMALEDLALPFLQQFVDTSLNDALPTFPLPTFTLPASLDDFGLPGGEALGLTSPTLTIAPQHFTLRGGFGLQ